MTNQMLTWEVWRSEAGGVIHIANLCPADPTVVYHTNDVHPWRINVAPEHLMCPACLNAFRFIQRADGH